MLKKIIDTLESVKIEMQKDNMSFAYGIVEYKPTDNLQHKIVEADEAMYMNKLNMKSS